MESVKANRNGEFSKCQHFSIRGYVSEMRIKNINTCRPFANHDSTDLEEDEGPELPPLDVPDFPRWSCRNCLRRIGAVDDPPRTEEVINNRSNGRGTIYHSPQCAGTSKVNGHVLVGISGPRDASRGNEHVPVQASGSTEASRENGHEQVCVAGSPEASRDNISGGTNNAGVMNVIRDEYRNVSLDKDMEKKEAADPTIEVNVSSNGPDNGMDENGNHTVEGTPSVASKDNPSLAEGATSGFDEVVISFNSNEHGCDLSEAVSLEPVKDERQQNGDGPEENVEQTVRDTISAAAEDNPCLSGAVTDGFDKVAINFNGEQHSCNLSANDTDASTDLALPNSNALETASLELEKDKGRMKGIISTTSEVSLKENQELSGKDSVIMEKQHGKEVSACGTGTINVEEYNGAPDFVTSHKINVHSFDLDIDESDHDSFDKDENSSGTQNRRRAKKVRMLVDIINSGASVASSRGCSPPKDANTDCHKEARRVCLKDAATDCPKETKKVLLGIDLNCAFESPVATEGNDKKVSAGRKGKRKIPEDESVKSLPKCDDKFNFGGNEARRVADGTSAFLPWEDNQRKQNETSEPAASHADIAGFMNELKQRRHLSYAEEAIRNSNSHISQASSTYSSVQPDSQLENCHASMGFLELSLSPPNPNPLGTNYTRTFVGGSSGTKSFSKPLELFPPESLMRREREKTYHPQTAGQLNLFANESLPAAHLLRLMNAGGCTSSSVDADKRQIFSEQPLPPCDHRFPKFPGMEFLQSKSCGASLRPPTSAVFDRFPGVQFGHASQSSVAFGKDFRSSDRLMSDAFMSQAKENVSKLMLAQPKRSRAKKRGSEKSNSGQIGQGSRSAVAPIPQVTKIQVRDSTTRVELDLNIEGGPEICTLNRNPADFSIPERGNEYMIGYKQLRPKRTGSSGQKRKRMVKPATVQELAKI